MADQRRRPTKRYKRVKKSRLGLWTSVVLLLLVAAYIGVLELSRPHVDGDRLRYDTLVDFVETGRIKTARVLDEDAYVVGTYEREGGVVRLYNAPLLRGTQSDLLGSLVANRVPAEVDQQVKKRVANLAATLLPGVMIVVLFGYLILSSRRGTGLFAIRSGARKIKAEEGGVTFADVAGQDAAVEELREIKDFLTDPERFAAMGATVPKGVLLYGAPGCGKTLLARAMAGEAGASFYSISGSDFVELYVGVGASRVRDLFAEARQNAPALIFIDEVDSVGRARGAVGATMSGAEQDQALNQILAEMDGFSTSEGIIVVAATNRPDILDPALLRPGRFDRTIGLEKPDEANRLAILKVHAKGKVLAPTADLSAIAHKAIGMTGADLASVMNEAALLAARASRADIAQEQLNQAVQRILEAPERQRRLSMRERSIGKRFSAEERVTFTDVAGQDSAVAELKEIKEFLAAPEKFTELGAQVPNGVLLYGPPGCGKTMLVKALASEANAAFLSVAASEFDEIFVGRGAARVRDLFAEAHSMPPSIIFIDEIDSIGRGRVGSATMQGEQGQALTQLLAEMDGFASSKGVIVVGATNRPDVLDPALLRPGRFDRSIGLERPDERGRLAILTLHARDKALDPAANLAIVARRAIGLTGADLANILNEAALLAARADRTTIGQEELEVALKRILEAPERQRRLSMKGRSIGRRTASDERVTFADVAGVDDAVEELAEVRQYLAEPERYANLGARVPRGILLSGPPGCGKTLLARALAGEVNAAFFSVAATEFVEIFVGEGASRVRELFGEAKAMAPAIVFIDEIDAIGGHRATASFDGGREREQTLNQILIELDGFEANAGLIVMAATNRPDMLDAALVRPGRFDRHVAISPPDRAGRRDILALYTRDKPLGPDVDLHAVAGLTWGMSGADLENVINEAALLAARQGGVEITMKLVEEGIDRARMGVASRSSIMSAEERRIVAHHEAGHAVVALLVPGATPPHKLTIVPRGGSLGHCSMVDDHDRVLLSRTMLMARMATLLGGMVAEELCFGESGNGPSSDLERVGAIARTMVRDYGMGGPLGPLAYPDEVGRDGRPRRSFSEDSAAMIDAEVRRLVDDARAQAADVLTGHRPALERVAEALLEHETLTAEELEKLAGSNGRRKR